MNIKIKTKNEMSRECLNCGKIFYFHISRKNTAKYCSRICKDASQRGQIAWNKNLTKEDYAKRPKEDLVLTNMCLNCGVPVRNKYCSRRCQLLHQNPNEQRKGKTYIEIYGELKAKEVQQKMSKGIAKTASETHFTKIGASVIGNIRRNKTWEQLYGEDEAKVKKDSIRRSLNEFRQTPEGIKVRQEASNRGIYLALSGKEFVNTKKGYFEGIYFGSSLEEQFLQQILKIIGSLKNVERNKTKIVPKGKGFKKTIPDYLIKDDNGKEIALVEIKSDHLLDRVETYEKASALYVYGQKQNILTGYFTYNTLNIFKKLQGNLEPSQLNSLLNYMRLELYNYVVNWKVQRLNVEDEDTNKTFKNIVLEDNVSNDPLPVMEGEIVRYPMKVGVC